MSNHFNDIESFASNRTLTSDTRVPGEIIMNRIQKATAAAVALAITLAGAAFVTAPMALADVQPLASHQSVNSLSRSAAYERALVRIPASLVIAANLRRIG